MKKMYQVLMAAAITSTAFAQSQRLVMVEEFTQASCGPCAAQNPAFNAVLAANSAKATSLKYQTSWPGVDPMNAQNPTEVQARVNYYAVNGVPDAIMDGNVYQGAPSGVTNATINTQYSVPSPFTIDLTHTMSSDYDSAFVTVNVTASQAYTSNGTLKLHVAMVEKEIIFTTPPGSNGEMDFHMVMRKMYPNANGTTLQGTWANNDTYTATFNVAVPTYIYNKNEIAFVAFIQSDGNKAIQQAALSNPILIPNDAAATAVTGVGGLSCGTTINPVVTIKNNGASTLTACDISYQIDNNTPAIFNWTGSLASGATTTVNLPTINVTAGSHTLTVVTQMPNGTQDYNTNGDNEVRTFTISAGAGVQLPLSNNMASSSFPYNNWVLNNPDAGVTWARVSTNGGSLKYDCFSYGTVGAIDEVIVEPVTLASLSNASLQFKVAHARYSTQYTDALEVLVSTDCGTTWTSVWAKSGATLATAATTTNAFTPTAAQWRAECVDLSSYVGQQQLFVMFRATNGYGNNIYVDDINISNTTCPTSINETSVLSNVNLFPNPANNEVTLSIDMVQSQDVVVNIFNTVGALVYTSNEGQLPAGTQLIRINTETLAAGMYTVEVRTANGRSVNRLSIQH